MHDLQFFRSNLDAVAARLAARGFQLDLEQFRDLDAERRTCAHRGGKIKSGTQRRQPGDRKAPQGRARIRLPARRRFAAIGEQISALDERRKEVDERFREVAGRHPEHPPRVGPSRQQRADDNVEVRTCRRAPAIRFRTEGTLGSRSRAEHSRLRAGGEDHRRAIRRLLRSGRQTRAGAHQLHARHAHSASTDIPKRCRPSSSTRRACSVPVNCRSSRRTFSSARTPICG